MSDEANLMVVRLFRTSTHLTNTCFHCITSLDIHFQFASLEDERSRVDAEQNYKLNASKEVEKAQIREELEILAENESTAHLYKQKEECKLSQRRTKFLKDAGCTVRVGVSDKIDQAKHEIDTCCQSVTRSVRQLNALRRTKPDLSVQLCSGAHEARLRFNEQLYVVLNSNELKDMEGVQDIKDLLVDLKSKLDHVYNGFDLIEKIGQTALVLPVCESVFLSMTQVLKALQNLNGEYEQKAEERKRSNLVSDIDEVVEYGIVVTVGSIALKTKGDYQSTLILLKLFDYQNSTQYVNINSSSASSQIIEPNSKITTTFTAKKLKDIEKVELRHPNDYIEEWSIETIEVFWHEETEERYLLFDVHSIISPTEKDGSIKKLFFQNESPDGQENEELEEHLSETDSVEDTSTQKPPQREKKSSKSTSRDDHSDGNESEKSKSHKKDNIFTKLSKKLKRKLSKTSSKQALEKPAPSMDESDISDQTTGNTIESKQLKNESQQKSELRNDKNVKYKIEIRTGDGGIKNSEVNVFISLYGDKDSFENIPLKDSTTNKQPFKKNTVDVFEIEGPIIGMNIIRVKLWLESNSTEKWFVHHVHIEAESIDLGANFDVKKWLDDKSFDAETGFPTLIIE
ncbi:hypothetical protein ACOME3_006946 [Neoechinorhynchus agilis]